MGIASILYIYIYVYKIQIHKYLELSSSLKRLVLGCFLLQIWEDLATMA